MPTLKADDPMLGVMAGMLLQSQVNMIKQVHYILREQSEQKARALSSRLNRERQDAEIKFLRSNYGKDNKA